MSPALELTRQFPLREHDARITGMRKDSSYSWVVFPQDIDIALGSSMAYSAIELQIMPFVPPRPWSAHRGLKKPKDISTEELFIKLLKKEAVFLGPGSDFGMRNHFHFHLMASPEDFNKALARIARYYGR